MILCPSCNHSNLEGDGFCDECGTPLPATSQEPAVVNPPFPTPPVPDPFVAPPPSPTPAPFGRPRFVLSNGQEIDLSQAQHLIIGRSDAATSWTAPLDLQGYLGDSVVAQGLGRKHAEVNAQGGQVTLSDLNSTNSTYIAGQKLAPMTPTPLVDGQEISLGRVTLQFRVM